MDINRQISEVLVAINKDELQTSVIAPMNFDIDAHIKSKNKVITEIGHNYYVCKKVNIWQDYTINGTLMEQLLARSSNPTIYTYNICGYIKQFISFNSNTIKLNIDKLQGYTGKSINIRVYYEAINYLCAMGVLRKTDKQAIYVVNPFSIFKGNMNLFLDIYNKAYDGKEIELVDDKLKIRELVVLYTNNGKILSRFISNDKLRRKEVESMNKEK